MWSMDELKEKAKTAAKAAANTALGVGAALVTGNTAKAAEIAKDAIKDAANATIEQVVDKVAAPKEEAAIDYAKEAEKAAAANATIKQTKNGVEIQSEVPLDYEGSKINVSTTYSPTKGSSSEITTQISDDETQTTSNQFDKNGKLTEFAESSISKDAENTEINKNSIIFDKSGRPDKFTANNSQKRDDYQATENTTVKYRDGDIKEIRQVEKSTSYNDGNKEKDKVVTKTKINEDGSATRKSSDGTKENLTPEQVQEIIKETIPEKTAEITANAAEYNKEYSKMMSEAIVSPSTDSKASKEADAAALILKLRGQANSAPTTPVQKTTLSPELAKSGNDRQ